MHHFRRTIALFLIFILSFSLCCCSHTSNKKTNISTSTPSSSPLSQKDDTSNINVQVSFDTFTDHIFTTLVQEDILTLKYNVANPETYNITSVPASIGSLSSANFQNSLNLTQSWLDELKKYPFDQLSTDQQLTYKILSYTLSDEMTIKDFYYYQELLGPTTGFQVQLPVLLAEYNYKNKNDIENYLKMLPSVYNYFNDICNFEKEKSAQGLFMSEQVVDSIVSQCKDFISEPESNYLITIFNDRIQSLNLTQQEKEQYIASNKQIILKYIIPAYQLLIDTLTALRGTDKNDYGLCHLEKGKDYYCHLVSTSTGSNRPISEIKSLLNDYLIQSMTSFQTALQNDSSIYSNYNHIQYPTSNAEETVNYLKSKIEENFPPLTSNHCTVKYVHKSLQDHISPAFYISAPVDSYVENSIYINPKYSTDIASIFTTIAHEGYPGHLYQDVYFKQQNPSLIRTLISPTGYCEGWAIYSELTSYDLANIESNMSNFLKSNLIFTLCLYSLVDIGIHYDGWTKDDTINYLQSMGVTNSDALLIFNQLLEEPSIYLPYSLGYIELDLLKKEAKEKLQSSYSDMSFHKFYLDMGPAPFPIIKEYFESWLQTEQK